MGVISIWHVLILATLALLLFGGRNKVSDLMGDIGRGVNSFKKGINEGRKEDPRLIDGEATPANQNKNTNGEATAANQNKDTVQR